MKWKIAATALLLLVSSANAQMNSFFPGPGTVHSTGGGGSYTGPGDIVSGASAWWGLRGYNAAYSTGSNPAVDLVDGAGLNPITINILSNGKIDVASISAWVTAHSVATIKVMKLYDQTGNGRHMIGVFASAPTMTVNCVNSMPCLVFASNPILATSAGFAVAQPFSIAGGFLLTGHTAVGSLLMDSTGVQFVFNTTPALRMQANTALNNATTLSDGTWYRVQGVANGVSSVATVNGSDTAGNAGTNGITAGHTLSIGNDDFSQMLNGSFVEEGVWPSGFSGGNRTSIDGNISAFWAI